MNEEIVWCSLLLVRAIFGGICVVLFAVHAELSWIYLWSKTIHMFNI